MRNLSRLEIYGVAIHIVGIVVFGGLSMAFAAGLIYYGKAIDWVLVGFPLLVCFVLILSFAQTLSGIWPGTSGWILTLSAVIMVALAAVSIVDFRGYRLALGFAVLQFFVHINTFPRKLGAIDHLWIVRFLAGLVVAIWSLVIGWPLLQLTWWAAPEALFLTLAFITVFVLAMLSSGSWLYAAGRAAGRVQRRVSLFEWMLRPKPYEWMLRRQQ